MKPISWVFALLIASFLVSANHFYADITIDVDEAGTTTIKGLSNVPILKEGQSGEFTSKKGNYWTFNLSQNHQFEEYVYTVNLPEGSVINFVKGPKAMRIGSEGGRPFFKATGKNESLNLAVQYLIEPSGSSSRYYIILAIPMLFLSGVAILFLIRKRRQAEPEKENNETIKTNPEPEQKTWYNKETLMDRQKEIVEIIEKSGPITQKKLEEQLKIPKSSLSRNIDSLVRQGIIKKEERGMSNVLCISPKKPEF